MKKATKFVLIALLVCAITAGTLFSTMLSGASNLTPADTFIQYQNANAVELSKTAERTGANTWQITLGVTNLLNKTVTSTPVEVALVIDASGSMTDRIPGAPAGTDQFVPELNATVRVDGSGNPVYKLDAAKVAAIRMINTLGASNINARIGITRFYSVGNVLQTTMLDVRDASNKAALIQTIRTISTGSGTNIQGGILKGMATFCSTASSQRFSYRIDANRNVTINPDSAFKNADTEKLMVVLTDGEANRYYNWRSGSSYNYINTSTFNFVNEGTDSNSSNSADAARKAATAVKNKLVTIYSIGFAYSDTTLEDIASPDPGNPGEKLYFQAGDAVALNAAFYHITNNIDSSALTDSMGSNLTTHISTVTGPTGVAIGANGGSLSWNPTAADLTTGRGNFITYTVTLDIANLTAGEHDNYALNSAASFGVSIDGNAVNGNFPQPTCEFDIGTLDVQFKAGSAQIAAAEAQQKTITDWTVPGTFTINTPPATIVYNGKTYYYSGSTYDGSAYTLPSGGQQTAAVGTHTLIHNYALHNHNVSYSYTGTVPSDAPSAPTSGIYAAGTPDIPVSVKPSLAGYTFNGWNTSDVTVSGDKFTMPDQDVAFTGSWTPNGNTAYQVQHYKQNLDGTYTPADTDILSGTTGASAGFTQKTYTGFTYDGSLTSSTNTVSGQYIIKGDGSLVIKLYYKRNIHTVTYAYTGTVPAGVPAAPSSADYAYETPDITVAGAPALAGYTFNSWVTSDVTATSGKFTMPDKDVAFTGSWMPNTDTAYKVEHYKQTLNGTYNTVPDETDELTGTTGAAAAFTPKSTYSGFTYAPSLTTSNNNAGSDFIIKGDGTLVITLYYTRNSYQVSYQYTGVVPDGATALPATVGASYGATVTVAANAAAAGYTFSNWNTPDATVNGNTFAMPANSVLFSGSFAPATVNYTVNYYLQKLDGSGYEPQTADKVTATGLTDAPGFYPAKNYTGYTFKEATSNNTVNNIFIIKGDGSLIISVYYDVNIHNVSYSYTNTVSGASTLPATIGVSYGATVTVAGNATAPGYTFGGWASTQTTATANQTFTMPDSDVTFSGGFTASEDTAYTVNYYTQNLDGFSYTIADFTNKTGTTGTAGSYDTTKAFAGYTYQKAESNLTPNTDFTIQGNGSLVINVYFTRNSYTVTYTYTGTVPAGVTPVKDYTIGVSFGASVTILNAACPPSHLFSGWTSSDPTTGTGGTFLMPAGNVTFTGSFSPASAEYTVEHYQQNLTGGGYTKAVTIGASGNIGSAASYSPETYEGFTYAPSLTISSNTPNTDFTIKADGSLTVKLYYTRNGYNVSYSYTNTVPGASELPATIGASYGATVTVAANGTAPGYTFGGWSTTDAAVSGNTFAMPAKDVALTGGFTPNSDTAYKVEHYKQILAGTYGSTPDEIDNLTGTTGASASFSAKNYTGFTHDASATTSNTGNFVVKGDGSLIIKLYYTRNTDYKYNVEYRKDSATGTLLDSKTVSNRTWGQTYSEDAIGILGYTAQAPLSQNVIIDADGKILIFIYKANKHNVTYQLTGTVPAGFDTSVLAGLGAAGIEFNTPMTRAAGLTAPNYNFTGWTTGDVTVGASGSYTMPDKDVVFTGSFTLMPAWVVYEYTGDVPAAAAALPETKYYNIGNSVALAPAPAAITGFTFEGWTFGGNTAPAGLTIGNSGEHRIIGNWVRNSYKVTYRYDSSAPATAPAVPAQQPVLYQNNVFVDTAVGNITGYTFKGWVPTSGIGNSDIVGGGFSMPAGDVVFTGSWAVNKHDVTYQLTGEIPEGFNPSVLAAIGASGVEYGTQMTVAAPLSLTDYDFHGWTCGQVTSVNGGYQMPDSDVVFTGYFTKKVFTVTYVYTGDIPANAPALPASGFYEVGAQVAAATPAGMMGYTFYGWTSDGIFIQNGKFTMPARNVVFTGRWVKEASSVPSSVASEPSIPSSTPSTLPSSTPSVTPTSPTITSIRPIVSINDTSAPLEVINMGGEENLTATAVIAAFSVIMLAAVAVISRKNRKV